MEAINGVVEAMEAKLGVGPLVAQVLTLLVVVLCAYFAFNVLQGFVGGKQKRKRGEMLLLLGQCGAGKTALFYQLKDQLEARLVSSLTANRDTLKIKVGDSDEIIGPIETIDYPGHQRFRGKQAELYKDSRFIVYVVDSEDKQKLKDAAEHLYEILTSQEVIDLHIPILLACNKSDLSSARTEKFIVEEIEREMEQMRVSRGATLEGQDQADSYLGVDGEKFKLVDHSPCPIEICRISTKKPELEPVYDFLRQQFVS